MEGMVVGVDARPYVVAEERFRSHAREKNRSPCAASRVEVQVSAGSRPLVSWNSRCRAIGVRIIEAQRLFNNDLPVWEITASTSTIRPPVIVGDDVPGTIRSGLGPADLAAGRLYVALVSIGELGATPVRRDSLRFMVR